MISEADHLLAERFDALLRHALDEIDLRERLTRWTETERAIRLVGAEAVAEAFKESIGRIIH